MSPRRGGALEKQYQLVGRSGGGMDFSKRGSVISGQKKPQGNTNKEW